MATETRPGLIPRLPSGAGRLLLALGLAAGQTLAVLLFWLTPDPGRGSAWRSLPLDDAWIHLVYARSVAERLAFEYNQGVAEAGMTSPGWVLILAAVLRAGGVAAPAVAAKLASLAFAIVAMLGAFHLAWRISGRLGAALAAVLLVSLPSWLVDAASGMEVTATAAILVWLADSLITGRRWLAVPLLAALPLFRPEGLAVAIVGAGLVALPVKAERLALWQRLAAAWLPLGIVIGLWIGYHLIAVGRPLPNTYYAKVETATLNPLTSLPNLGVSYGVPLIGGSAVGWILFASLVPLGALAASRLGTRAFLASVLGPGFGFAVLIVRPLPPTALDFTGSRYLDPALPAIVALAGAGAALLIRRAPLSGLGRAALTALWLVPILGGALGAWPDARHLYAGSTANIEEVDEAIGRWLASRVPSGARIATFDAGAIKWFLPDHEVIDVVGLNTSWAVRQPLSTVLDRSRPDFLVYWSLPAVESLRAIDKTLLRVRPEQNYILGGDEATVWSLRFDAPERAPDLPLLVPLAGWTVVDSIDIGNAASEAEHRYRADPVATRRDSSRVGDAGFTTDDSRILRVTEAERFDLELCPVSRNALVVRYDGRSFGTIELRIGDRTPTTVELPQARTILTEVLIPIPGELVAGDAVPIQIRPLRTPSGFFAAYRYWSLAAPGC